MHADYLTKVVVVGKQSTSTNVREIMTPQNKLMTVTPQSSVVDVMALMTANNFRHVPVVRCLQLCIGLTPSASLL